MPLTIALIEQNTSIIYLITNQSNVSQITSYYFNLSISYQFLMMKIYVSSCVWLNDWVIYDNKETVGTSSFTSLKTLSISKLWGETHIHIHKQHTQLIIWKIYLTRLKAASRLLLPSVGKNKIEGYSRLSQTLIIYLSQMSQTHRLHIGGGQRY